MIAGLLVEDHRVIEEMLAWQKYTLPIHGMDVHVLMIDALVEALRDVSDRAADALEDARTAL